MKNNIDYRYLVDIAKLNLSNKLNEKIEEYKKKHNMNTKKEIVNLIQDRQQIFLFNTSVIEKYI